MARLGELLVEAKLLSIEQIEQALRAQVMWGGRLGTNLVELGLVDLDALATALSRQHKLPAALARHFDKADREVQQKLSPAFAERFAVVPLMRVKNGKVVVATLAPLDARGVAIIADELGCTVADLVVSVAPELRIRYQLERSYGIPRGARFLRARGKTAPPFPQFKANELQFEDSQVQTPITPDQRAELQALHDQALAEPSAAPEGVETPVDAVPDLIELGDADLSDVTTPMPRIAPTPAAPKPVIEVASEPVPALDVIASAELAIPQEPVDESTQRERRKYVSVITEPTREQRLGRIAIRRVAVTTQPQNQTLGEAARAIRRSTDRDKVAELVMLAIERFFLDCETAVMLVVRGDVAIGWKSFSRSGGGLPELAVPLEQPGLVATCVRDATCMRSPMAELGELDQVLFETLGGHDERELLVVPVTIANQVMLAIALVITSGCEIGSAETIATATGAAFARLMRDASR
jgi:hypothetical protein